MYLLIGRLNLIALCCSFVLCAEVSVRISDELAHFVLIGNAFVVVIVILNGIVDVMCLE